jgi:hypothetical protein
MRKREKIERKSEDRSRKTEDRSLKSEKMLSDRDNSLSDRDNTLSDSREIQSGWVETLSVSQKTLSGRLAGQSVFEINATGRVNSLSGRVNPQSGKGFNFLFLISYSLFPENKKHRIRNNKSGILGTPQRGEISITPGFNPGMSAPTTSCPSFNAPALAPDFRLTNNECKKNDIKNIPDFSLRGSRYFGIGGLLIPMSDSIRLLRQGEGPVVHRAQAVRACLLPLLQTLTTNASAFFRHGFFNN